MIWIAGKLLTLQGVIDYSGERDGMERAEKMNSDIRELICDLRVGSIVVEIPEENGGKGEGSMWDGMVLGSVLEACRDWSQLTGRVLLTCTESQWSEGWRPAVHKRIVEKVFKLDVAHDDVGDRKSTRLNSSHTDISRMPSSA